MKELFEFRKTVYSHLAANIKGSGKMMTVYFMLLLIPAAAGLLMPQLYSMFVDEVLIGGRVRLFSVIAAGYVLLYGLSAGTEAGLCILMNRMRNTLEYSLRRKALDQVMRPGRTKTKESEIGDIKMKLDNDISCLSSFFQEQFGKFEIQIMLTAGSGFFLLVINRELALLGITVIPLTLWMDHVISRKESILNEENRQNDSLMASWLYSIVKGWRQIRMFGQGKRQERRYIRFQHKYALYNARWINFWVTRYLIIPKIKNEFLMEFGVYFIGGLMILKGRMTAGELLVFIVYYRQLTDSMTEVSSFQATLQSNMPVYRRAASWTDDDIDNAAGIRAVMEDERTITKIRCIEFVNMGFRYSQTAPFLIKNLCGKYAGCGCVGVKGKSGSGKSTFLKLLLRVEEPVKGEIRIDGTDLRKINPGVYYRRISGYMQGSYPFSGTIRENLQYAVPDASEEEMKEACRKAQILEDILKMPDQFDTLVGERGCMLSGGQRQRLLLARAFLKDADVYYFDEPASALDRDTAEAVYGEIGRLSDRKIVFLISHDQEADRICNKFISIDR